MLQATHPNAATPTTLDLAFVVLNSPNFAHAACANRDPEWWSDAVATSGNGITKIGQQAVAICSRCTHEDACLQYALDEQIPHHIFGGLTASERKELLA